MIRSEQAHLLSLAATHPGMAGKINEDRFAVTAFHISDQDPSPVMLAVLCDGIGGHQAGEVAAEMAVEIISQFVTQSDGANPPFVLQNAVTEASERIRKFALENSDYEGMGSTCAIAYVSGGTLYTGTIGDSRIYLMRSGKIRQLSTDHTWIQEAIDAGMLRPDEAKGHPNAHIIRRYLGSPRPPQLDMRMHHADYEFLPADGSHGMGLRHNDRILLCSDGLTDLVSDAEILDYFQRLTPEAAIQGLIDLANDRGGHDNITIVFLQVPPTPVTATKKFPWKTTVLGCVTVLAAALVLTAIGFGLWSYVRGSNLATSTPSSTTLQFATQPAVVETITPAPPTPTLEDISTLAPTQTLLPILQPQSGPTLTAWPTNTLAPTLAPSLSPTVTPTR